MGTSASVDVESGNIEKKLIELGKIHLKEKLELHLGFLKEEFIFASKGGKYLNGKYDELKKRVNNFEILTNKYLTEFGVGFPDIQKQYEAMLPKINKYLEVKTE